MSADHLFSALKDINEMMMTKSANRIVHELSKNKDSHVLFERELFLTVDKNVQQLVDYLTTSLLAFREELGPNRVSSLLLGIAGRCASYNKIKEKVYDEHMVKVKKLEEEFGVAVRNVLKEELKDGHHLLDGIYAGAFAQSQQYFDGQNVREFSMEHGQDDIDDTPMSNIGINSYVEGEPQKIHDGNQLNQKQSMTTHSVSIEPKVSRAINNTVETTSSSDSVHVPLVDALFDESGTNSSLNIINILKMLQSESKVTDRQSAPEHASSLNQVIVQTLTQNANIDESNTSKWKESMASSVIPTASNISPEFNKSVDTISSSDTNHVCKLNDLPTKQANDADILQKVQTQSDDTHQLPPSNIVHPMATPYRPRPCAPPKPPPPHLPEEKHLSHVSHFDLKHIVKDCKEDAPSINGKRKLYSINAFHDESCGDRDNSEIGVLGLDFEGAKGSIKKKAAKRRRFGNACGNLKRISH